MICVGGMKLFKELTPFYDPTKEILKMIKDIDRAFDKLGKISADEITEYSIRLEVHSHRKGNCSNNGRGSC